MSGTQDTSIERSDAETQLQDVEQELALLEDRRGELLVTRSESEGSRPTSFPEMTKRYVSLLEMQATLRRRITPA